MILVCGEALCDVFPDGIEQPARVFDISPAALHYVGKRCIASKPFHSLLHEPAADFATPA